jgi:hypothetical protein
VAQQNKNIKAFCFGVFHLTKQERNHARGCVHLWRAKKGYKKDKPGQSLLRIFCGNFFLLDKCIHLKATNKNGVFFFSFFLKILVEGVTTFMSTGYNL